MDATPEEWRPVVGYEGCYEVSSHGRVMSIARAVHHPAGGVRMLKERFLQPHEMRSGHLQVNLHREGHGKCFLVHRMVLEAFVGPCPDGMEGCHNDGHPTNNHVANLRWDTRTENNRDIVRHGTHNNARKTRCPRGHRYDAVNSGGARYCSKCKQAFQAARYLAANKEDRNRRDRLKRARLKGAA